MSKSKIDSQTTIEDLAVIVYQHLESNNITAVLSGGSVVTIYTSVDYYESKDLDFVSPDPRSKLVPIMNELGFTPSNSSARHFKHALTKILIEFPIGPLSLGGPTPLRYHEIPLRKLKNGKVRMLTPTQSVMDRLLHFISTGDRQALDQAKWIAQKHDVDAQEIMIWAHGPGEANEDQMRRIEKIFHR